MTATTTPKFRFYIFELDGMNVRGTNNEKLAREFAKGNWDAVVLDTQAPVQLHPNGYDMKVVEIVASGS